MVLLESERSDSDGAFYEKEKNRAGNNKGEGMYFHKENLWKMKIYVLKYTASPLVSTVVWLVFSDELVNQIYITSI